MKLAMYVLYIHILCRYYDGIYHNVDEYDDGFFFVTDSFKNRKIYVCRVEVGRSKAFHDAFNICHFVDLVRTNDEHSIDLGRRQQDKVYQQICSIALQIADCDGNICIFCGRGRTRSPVHIAAYLIVVHCYSPEEARAVLSYAFVLHRSDTRGIDRDNRFNVYLNRLVADIASVKSRTV